MTTTTKKTAERMLDLFRGNETHHGTHGTPKLDDNGLKWGIRSTAKTIKGPVTEMMWSDHLSGKRPLGIVPITNENLCWWGSIDVDEYDIDILEIVARAEKLPLVPCRSKSGGLHLFLFVTEAIDAKEMQGSLREIAAMLGLSGSEIFPKQVVLNVDRGDFGSWIVMPYFGGDFGGKLKMQYGLKKTGAEMTISEFLNHAEKTRQTPEKLREIRTKKVGQKHEEDSDEETGTKKRRKRPPFHDGPPCLTYLVTQEGGVQQGGQNNTLFHMGVYFKKTSPDKWQSRLEEANVKFFNPPLPADDVTGVIKSLNKKDYQYKCKDQPMVNHCDPIACRMKKYGVGAAGTYPVIEQLAMLNVEPAIWVVTIESQNLEMSTDDLQNYMRFHKICMEKLQVCYITIRQDVWLGIVSEAMASESFRKYEPDKEYKEEGRTILISSDISQKKVFEEILETFLTNKQRGQKEEDLLSGRPWENEEDGQYYFRVANLEKFLIREGMRDITRPKIIRLLKEKEAKHEQRHIKNKYVNVWVLGKEKVSSTPQIGTPDVKENPI